MSEFALYGLAIIGALNLVGIALMSLWMWSHTRGEE
jgi:hypothetical protein